MNEQILQTLSRDTNISSETESEQKAVEEMTSNKTIKSIETKDCDITLQISIDINFNSFNHFIQSLNLHKFVPKNYKLI